MTETAAEQWDARYLESDRIWSGNPNDSLVRETADLAPGRALDLGCGEGGDAIWLAKRGWAVTGTDLSVVALGRARQHAEDEGVGDRVELVHIDLSESFPEGTFDLVSAHFLHSFAELAREDILRRASRAVAPGGVLLVESHSGMPDWEEHDHHHDMEFKTPEEILADLELADGEWETLRCVVHERAQKRPDGTDGVRLDNTVMVRRIA
ncbi:class I SAM-dependent methyltransferase [Rhodococcus sp. HNM0569]|uniref:SAM-dependent methyltransferase n=1 Tax=Rhodococcus sp. HNM0569 TaxID=2716340 RepID=UPI00146A9A34|nr:class I SAM-dependent methyltransferase [Rhodococcus sp. HNM0569]NLU81632.1 class I SAM-dependent methyltransferase [Rhodococcus sp. HNM0569]